MTRRTLGLALVLLGAMALAHTPGWANISCREAWQYSTCNSACLFEGQGHCTYVWAFDTCGYTYTCETGMPISGTCTCPEQQPPPGGCFLAGTPITMADGTTKPIEEIAVGDVVLAYDKATGVMKPDPVKRLHKPVTVDSYLLVNGELRITATQPVFSGGKWIEMGQLKVGDTLTSASGEPLAIETIAVVQGPITVYNFDTNPYETFVAGGVIVHRKQDITEP
jgi:pretoxin HINT domain-containing protein